MTNMSKLDYITIAIVVVCVAALIYLVYSVISLMGNPKPAPTEQVESPPADDFYDEDSTYTYESGGYTADGESAPGPDSTTYDYDAPDPADTPADAGSRTPTSYEEEESATDADPEPYEETERADPYDPSAAYMVVAGTFEYKDGAEAEVRRLRNLGYASAEYGLFNRGAYAAVIVDRFSDVADARALAEELRTRHGIEAYVHEKRGVE